MKDFVHIRKKVRSRLLFILGISLSFTLQAQLPSPTQDTDFHENGQHSPEKVKLGKKLFFDKLLSGNLNISCATCHSPLTGTGDGLSLPVGEGGVGLGVTRVAGDIVARVPRNAPPIFNLGAREFTTLFHDGRIEVLPSGEFISPAGTDLPSGLDNLLAVQAMFPVTSADEMAGQIGAQNFQGTFAFEGNLPQLWEFLANKLRANPGYVRLFKAAFQDILTASDITYVHAANAIAAFEASAWRFDNSPFDQFLAGDASAMSAKAIDGMNLFYGAAGCSGCHSGVFQTDHDFHAIAMPQIGPGKGHGQGLEDFGRGAITGKFADRYKFITPSLRNVMLTAPYGHNGAYKNIRQVILHHLDPLNAIENYNINQAKLPKSATLPDDFLAHNKIAIRNKIKRANELNAISLSNKQIKSIEAFLAALTDVKALDMRNDAPLGVPSGLPVFD